MNLTPAKTERRSMNNTDRPDFSFCTWILNRREIRSTLPINLAMAAGASAEFVVVDVGSSRPLSTWIARKNGWRRMVRTERIERDARLPVHFSRDKNRAHALGVGRILVNLDGDNILGPRYCRDVLRAVYAGADLVHTFSGNWGDGTCGRVAITRESFAKLGGYDESFEPVGYQDIDLVERARAAGLVVRTIPRPECVGASVHSARIEKMRYVVGDFDEMNAENQRRSRENVRRRRLVANQGNR